VLDFVKQYYIKYITKYVFFNDLNSSGEWNMNFLINNLVL